MPVDWGLSQRPARVDCGLSYTTGQATIARSAIVPCGKKDFYILFDALSVLFIVNIELIYRVRVRGRVSIMVSVSINVSIT